MTVAMERTDSAATSGYVAEDHTRHTWKNTILRSHGRPPWYTQDGRLIGNAFVIGIAGGSASGKTHVARQIVKSLGHIPSVVILSQDSFYKKLDPEQSKRAFDNMHDFDHPDALDMSLFAGCLADLKRGEQSNVPIYSFSLHQRLEETTYLYGASIIIAEGIMALQDPVLRNLYDLKVFVQCDSDLMLARRLKRDITERGRTVDGVLEQYLRFVKPSYDAFVQPTSKYADIIVPGHENNVAIELITTHVQKMLNERSAAFRKGMADAQRKLKNIPRPDVDKMLTVLPQNSQLKGMMTILRNVKTLKSDFIFYTDRLATLVIETAMTLLPFKSFNVMTPIGVEANGLTLAAPRVCGVEIIRSGGPLQRGLARCIRDVELGALLIQTDSSTGEPMLLHSTLPNSIRHRDRAAGTYVFLLDAQIGTGASAMMAIRVLLDHGVPANQIIFATFLVASGGGIVTIQEAFPGVRVVTAAVDAKLKEGWVGDAKTGRRVWHVEPGMGHLGDRYY